MIFVKLKSIVIQSITPLIWRLSPVRMIHALSDFSLIEKDSGCQLIPLISEVEDPKVKAYLFQHVLEEFFHAEIFEEVRLKYSKKFLPVLTIARQDMLKSKPSLEEVIDLIAYIQIGESAARADFLAYSKADIPPPLRGVFARAGMDEDKHEGDLLEILQRMAGSDVLALEAVRRSMRKRHKNVLTDYLNSIADFLLKILLSAVYFTLGWIGRLSPSSRVIPTEDEKQLRILRQQLNDLRSNLT